MKSEIQVVVARESQKPTLARRQAVSTSVTMESHHLRYEIAVRVDPSSGLPDALETVGQSLTAVERLPRSVTDRVHWRCATAILRLVSTGQASDVALARQVLTSALAAEGWLAKSGSFKRDGAY